MKRQFPPRPVPALPRHGRGQRIGILGGTFNPPHEAHRLISLIALRRLNLDAVWWLVTPGNPLKNTATLPTTAERVLKARKMANHPRILVTGIEEAMGTRFTFDSLNLIKLRASGVRFIWLMGADNLENFHRWNRWRDIARLMPIAVIDRPGATHHAVRSRSALAFEFARKPEQRGHSLGSGHLPALVIIHDRRSLLSSTALRKRHNFADK